MIRVDFRSPEQRDPDADAYLPRFVSYNWGGSMCDVIFCADEYEAWLVQKWAESGNFRNIRTGGGWREPRGSRREHTLRVATPAMLTGFHGETARLLAPYTGGDPLMLWEDGRYQIRLTYFDRRVIERHDGRPHGDHRVRRDYTMHVIRRNPPRYGPNTDTQTGWPEVIHDVLRGGYPGIRGCSKWWADEDNKALVRGWLHMTAQRLDAVARAARGEV